MRGKDELHPLFLREFSDELQVRHRDDISLTLVDFSVDVMQEYNRSWNSGTSSPISFITGVGLHSILY